MSLHPYAEGNIAAARRELRKCIEQLERACQAKQPEAWAHVAMAHTAAMVAKAQLDDAFEVDRMFGEMAVTAGGGK